MIEGPLVSPQHEVEDLDAAIEICYRKGWTDGLPVVPPTEDVKGGGILGHAAE